MFEKKCLFFDFDGVLLDSYNPKKNINFFNYHVGNKLPLVSGMEKVVSELADKYLLYIISSSSVSTIRSFLALHHLQNYFTKILGSENSFGKADKMKEIIVENRLVPDQCLFVTDTADDIKEAHLVGVPVLAVTWGYGRIDEISKAGPEAIINKPSEIVSWLNKI